MGQARAFESKSKKDKKADSVCDGEGLHVLGDAVYVGDVRPFLGVGVDAHIYQFSQLRKRKIEQLRFQVYEFIDSIVFSPQLIQIKITTWLRSVGCDFIGWDVYGACYNFFRLIPKSPSQ